MEEGRDQERKPDPLIEFFASLMSLDFWNRAFLRPKGGIIRALGVLLGLLLIGITIWTIPIFANFPPGQRWKAVLHMVAWTIYAASLLVPFRILAKVQVIRWAFLALSVWFLLDPIADGFRAREESPRGGIVVLIAVVAVAIGNFYLLWKAGGLDREETADRPQP